MDLGSIFIKKTPSEMHLLFLLLTPQRSVLEQLLMCTRWILDELFLQEVVDPRHEYLGIWL